MKHIVFDIDGTLLSTEYSLLHSLQDTLLTVTGRHYPLDELTFILGIPGVDSLERLNVPDIPGTLELWLKNLEDYAGTVALFPGIEALLAQLSRRGYRMGIVTSQTRSNFEKGFGSSPLRAYFGTVVCADDTERHKPNPDPLLKYAQLTGAHISDMTYVGDSPYDAACAESAGVRFFLAVWGARQSVPTPPGHRPATPEALLELL